LCFYNTESEEEEEGELCFYKPETESEATESEATYAVGPTGPAQFRLGSDERPEEEEEGELCFYKK
jgi:hypothetical protein